MNFQLIFLIFNFLILNNISNRCLNKKAKRFYFLIKAK